MVRTAPPSTLTITEVRLFGVSCMPQTLDGARLLRVFYYSWVNLSRLDVALFIVRLLGKGSE